MIFPNRKCTYPLSQVFFFWETFLQKQLCKDLCKKIFISALFAPWKNRYNLNIISIRMINELWYSYTMALYPKKSKVDWYGLVYKDSHKYN